MGYQVIYKDTNPNYPDTNWWIASVADSKYTSIVANSWSTTLPKAKHMSFFGGRPVEIDYLGYMYWYFFGRHAVEDNNNNNPGCLSFEDTFAPNQ